MMERLLELERAKVVSKVRKMTRNVTTPLYLLKWLRLPPAVSVSETLCVLSRGLQNNKSCSRVRTSTFLEVE